MICCKEFFSSFLGTHRPIWVKVTKQPSENKIVLAKACLRAGTSTCSRTWTIGIKNCTRDAKNFLIYYLPLVRSCPMRYCAGKTICNYLNFSLATLGLSI